MDNRKKISSAVKAEQAESEWQKMLSGLDESDKKMVEYLRKLHEARNQEKDGKEAAVRE